ncbi:hypothetical protein [Persephonella sp.]
MDRVIIETKNEKELKIKISLTSEQVEKLLKEFEERKKAEVALDKLMRNIKNG